MKIQLNIHYGTETGEALFLNIQNADGTVRTVRMANMDGDHWQCEQTVEPGGAFCYYYSVVSDGVVRHTEWTTQAHRLNTDRQGVSLYVTWDVWIDMPHDTYLYTSAFTQCVNRREAASPMPLREQPTCIRLKVRAPQLRGYERLVMVGSHPVLGDWSLDRALRCVEQAPNEWVCEVSAEYLAEQDIEFKFVAVRDGNELDSPLWETEDNRRLHVPRLRGGSEGHEKPGAGLCPSHQRGDGSIYQQ